MKVDCGTAAAAATFECAEVEAVYSGDDDESMQPLQPIYLFV